MNTARNGGFLVEWPKVYQEIMRINIKMRKKVQNSRKKY